MSEKEFQDTYFVVFLVSNQTVNGLSVLSIGDGPKLIIHISNLKSKQNYKYNTSIKFKFQILNHLIFKTI